MSKKKRLKLSMFFPIVSLIVVASTVVFATTFKGLGLKTTKERDEAKQELEKSIAEPTPTPRPQAKALFPYLDEISLLWGYKDENGEIRITPQYSKALEFSEEFAFVSKITNIVESYALIDKTGAELTGYNYSDVKPFSQGFAAVKVGEKWGFIDTTGAEKIVPSYTNVGSFNEGYAWVEKDGKFGYISATDKLVVAFDYDKANDVSQDKAIAGAKDASGAIKNFIINIATMETTETLQEFSIGTFEGTVFSENWAAVKVEKNKYNFINSKNTKLLASEYDDALNFSNNLAAVKKDNKWGYINLQGILEIQLEFDEAKEFSNEWAAVKVGSQWGYIKYDPTVPQKYAFVVSPRFDSATSIKDGFATVTVNTDSINILDQEKTQSLANGLIGATVPIYTIPPAIASDAQTGTVMLKTGALNVRQDAKKDSPLITTVPNGEKVEIISDAEDWLEIKYKDIQGYALKEYILQEKTN